VLLLVLVVVGVVMVVALVVLVLMVSVLVMRVVMGLLRDPGTIVQRYARLFQEDEEMRSKRGMRWLRRMGMNTTMRRITRTRIGVHHAGCAGCGESGDGGVVGIAVLSVTMSDVVVRVVLGTASF
jgi:hypothetical protein